MYDNCSSGVSARALLNVLDLAWSIDLPSHEQMPVPRRFLASRIHPHASVEDFVADCSARALSCGDLVPGARRLLGRPIIHTPPPASLTCRPFEPHQVIAMHIHHEPQSGPVQRQQECVLPVCSVCRDPLEPDLLLDCLDTISSARSNFVCGVFQTFSGIPARRQLSGSFVHSRGMNRRASVRVTLSRWVSAPYTPT